MKKYTKDNVPVAEMEDADYIDDDCLLSLFDESECEIFEDSSGRAYISDGDGIDRLLILNF